MSEDSLKAFRHGEALALADVPALPTAEFREAVIGAVKAGRRVTALFGQPLDGRAVRLIAVLAAPSRSMLEIASTDVRDSYRALTPECPQVHWFEREIAEQWGVTPDGHPWLKPIRFHPALNGQRAAPGFGGPDWPSVGDTRFFKVHGEEIHEVAVGPVHAGIIEPGHFRFQCHGENVFHLEISLGYQHRGVERALLGGPDKRTIHYMETLAGDTTAGHALAYCMAMEALSGCRVSARAEVVRGIALELERLANHTGDLGALAGDVGYLPTASYCGRIRGDFLNMTAVLCGNRFSRGLLRPGGLGCDIGADAAEELSGRIAQAERDVASAVGLLWSTPSVMARFERTGVVSRETCEEMGLVGPAARACGVESDHRFDFPSGIYCYAQIPVSSGAGGDVFARAYVRWLEIQRSIEFVKSQLTALPEAAVRDACGEIRGESLVVSLVEGWRGEICHVAITGPDGRFRRYKVVDPSFHNWMGLAMAMRGQQISDFPLCNKSFNLSYCGHDL